MFEVGFKIGRLLPLFSISIVLVILSVIHFRISLRNGSLEEVKDCLNSAD